RFSRDWSSDVCSSDLRLAASARSISGFDVYNALEACSEHIEQFGGHKYAAGLTLKEENYEVFKQAFEDEVSRTIDKHLLVPEIKIGRASCRGRVRIGE